ncbi:MULTISPECIES: LLM class flavin-dependent oxidoreductase [unclassified Beijerinckia]|uniref:LLM class flavin-dependent oxidoreductase n=1 Tax=unclassified Beijerinckia TaxID=2638183 RepID=UPI0008992986|nr:MULTISPECIES: LLM class flavin-dependent oxidoreductase [unclassified Beijerinckia]MDH7796014.1 FMNH2-dependent dimethyl sulfone monooxygenase [Beijerinckia sp. GAS462]SEC26399.1 dimethylsulfone monooxygenase [Beijerinckia sp. 28-YEA-48]
MDAASHQRKRNAMYNGNALKIGLFGANCSSGRAVTQIAERWTGNWPDNRKLAQLADNAGLDFMLPIARWKGYGGDTDYQGTTLETVTWATALLSATKHITVFGTVHAPLFHPIIAAKEYVTADLVGAGRFGLNLVVGWNQDEFDMFGVSQREHDARYSYGQEWIDAVKMAWSDAEDFNFDGDFIKLKNVRAKPKPFGGSQPMIMNAGSSGAGRAFALRNCNAFFTNAPKDEPDEIRRHVQSVKEEAAKIGREIDVYTVGVITCRPTAKEAEDYYRYAVIENADWSAVDSILAKRRITPQSWGEIEFQKERLHTANGMGGLPIIGDPDMVARQLIEMSRAGLRGVGASFINYLEELPYFCAEVLPRLEKAGIRIPIDR